MRKVWLVKEMKQYVFAVQIIVGRLKEDTADATTRGFAAWHKLSAFNDVS